MSLAQVTELARALDERVVELARVYRAQTISPPRSWYGFDAIHIRLRATPRAGARFCWAGHPAWQRRARRPLRRSAHSI